MVSETIEKRVKELKGEERGSGGSSDGSADPDMEPDTFWALIENLLLHTVQDEARRKRHNAALSALCRGYALPRRPREPSAKKVIPDRCLSLLAKFKVAIKYTLFYIRVFICSVLKFYCTTLMHGYCTCEHSPQP